MTLNVLNNTSRALLLTLVVGGGFWISSANDNAFSKESKATFRSLERALSYVESHPESTNPNLILGVLMAKANLQWIANLLDDLPRAEGWSRALQRLISLCRRLIRDSPYSHAVLEEALWEGSAGELKSGALGLSDEEFALPVLDSCRSIDEYVMRGTPEDSDFCIDELLNSKCNVSEKCWLSELNGDFHFGYKTTHRLLYFQVAQRLKCEELSGKFAGARAVRRKLCERMLSEAGALWGEGRLPLVQDLFMEQVALCGLEGHEEFAPGGWRGRVRGWQGREGCFGQLLSSANCSADGSQDDGEMGRKGFAVDGCHSHVTAVAISALAFFLRVTLRAAF